MTEGNSTWGGSSGGNSPTGRSPFNRSFHLDLQERMDALVDAPLPVEDALAALFDHSDQTLQARAIETYVRRLYQPYLVKGSIRIWWEPPGLIATWQFWEENPPPSSSTLASNGGLRMNPRGVQRWGAMVLVLAAEHVTPAVALALDATSSEAKVGDGTARMSRSSTMVGAPSGSGNMLHVAIIAAKGEARIGGMDSGDQASAEARVAELSAFLNQEETGGRVHQAGVELVSCILQRDEGRPPARHCFTWGAETRSFKEQPLLRHVEPPLSNLLELGKLRATSSVRYAPSRDRQWHMYSTTDKGAGTRRMFLRALVRQPPSFSDLPSQPTSPTGSSAALSASGSPFAPGSPAHPSLGLFAPHGGGGLHPEGGEEGGSAVAAAHEGLARAIQGALEELEMAAHDSAGRADHVHMFLCLLRAVMLPPKTAEASEEVGGAIEGLVRGIDRRLGRQMHKLGVAIWEVRLRVGNAGRGSGAWRAVVSNPSGHACIVEVYREAIDPVKAEAVYLSPLTPPLGSLHGTPLAAPYRALDTLEKRRLSARRNGTTFCYDFPLVFRSALASMWEAQPSAFSEAPPLGGGLYVEAHELVWPEDSPGGWGVLLVETARPPAKNNVGMVAWRLTLRTPEYPEGRDIIAVANDCTFGAGAFGVREDALFQAATDLACRRRLPLIYLAANSGARIGVAEEVKAAFRIGWIEDAKPNRGFQYLYFTPEEYARLQGSVRAEPVTVPGGEVRYVITDVIGKEDGLGIENLSGSGAIASAFARAYRETFTLTFVTGRTVGIGAYLARLGQRCIQRLDQPIILTGFSALNKLLGREVYSSHMQLGGPRIMACNGVVHATVADDLEGALAILKWLSYVPATVEGVRPPPLYCADPIDRPVQYTPELTCDPRAAIRGIDTPGSLGVAKQTDWLGGIFDQGSFTESLEGWAQTVVTGRARLGGVAVGVVAVETQTVMLPIPADPGQPDTHERVVPQAGQVWFPDSAAKTAQALQDFNQEGLPLFILANWRGFSGGQRDLFEGVLQAGSLIVEHLRTYKHPAFVYIPKTGELRGGAWVVVDRQINSEMIEMYADPSARGGVLEPEGMVEIKYRNAQLLETMHRLDPALIVLDKAIASVSSNEQGGAAALKRKVREREQALLPTYRQIALKFADLHDTPQRMAAKKVIAGVVPWAGARAFFARRLRCRLAQESLIAQILAASPPGTPRSKAKATMRLWFTDFNPQVLTPKTPPRTPCKPPPSGQPPAPEESGGGGGSPEEDDLFVRWVGESKGAIEERLKVLKEEGVAQQVVELGGDDVGRDGVSRGVLALLRAQATPSQKQDLARRLQVAIETALAEENGPIRMSSFQFDGHL